MPKQKSQDETCTIKNVYGKSLTANGSSLSLSEYSGSSGQRFNIISNKDGSYSIQNSQVCIALDNSSRFILEPVVFDKSTLPVIGDINASGSIETADLVMLQKYLLGAGTLTNPSMADVNQDGAVDIFDSVSLRKLLISSVI